MKESMWGYYLILLGIAVSTFMIMITNMTTTNQQDYYLLKEVTNAAMIDAIDYGYYRTYGEMKINTEKFVENFIRRFTEGISKTNSYKIDFYSIYENPPSVSIKVTSNTGDYQIFGDSTNIDVVNSIDAILEANNTITIYDEFYSVPYGECAEYYYITNDKKSLDYEYCQIFNRALFNVDAKSIINKKIQEKFNTTNIDEKKIKILSVEYLRPMSSVEDMRKFENQYKETYNRDATVYDLPNIVTNKTDYFAKEIKDVNVTVKEEDGKYYLAYSLKYKCENTIKLYSNCGSECEDVDNIKYITESQYNELNANEKAEWKKPPFYNACLTGIQYKINFYYDE